MNHIKEALKSKNGDAYIWLCVIVVFISMLLSVLILYMGLLSQVQIQKREVKTKLDSVVSEYATEMFDAIKQGAPSERYIDYDGLVRKTYARLGFPSDTVTEYAYPNGNCVMIRPQVTSLKGDGFGITVRYTVVFPIKWNGNIYKAIGVTDEIILDTFSDVSLRANLYYKQHGKIGISKDDVVWFRHIMNVHIFKIGVLQYQTFNMVYLDEETIGEPYMVFTQEQKRTLPNGSPVINCHIQKGANISDSLVKKSFDQAKVFFKDHFPSTEYKAFLCYSWLLYPPMLNMLPKDSNIKQFAKHFSIIGACNDSEQAKENLFDYGKHNLPCKPTALQRIAKEHKELLGYGCGVIML